MATIYLERIKSGTICEKTALGRAKFDDHGRISARRYNELKQTASRLQPAKKRKERFRLTADDGLIDTFGGYPAFAPVLFATEN